MFICKLYLLYKLDKRSLVTTFYRPGKMNRMNFLGNNSSHHTCTTFDVLSCCTQLAILRSHIVQQGQPGNLCKNERLCSYNKCLYVLVNMKMFSRGKDAV